MQREAISRASAARGDDIGAQWYEEKRSAKTMMRPVLEHVRQLAREGHVSRLYVWRLDRLARSGIRDTLAIVDELRRHGCELVTLADGFDLGGPAAEIVLAVLAWAAQMELRAITERREAARDRVLAAGGTWGRPKRIATGSPVERRIAALDAEGRSVRAIAVALKVPRATVARTLRRLKSPPANGALPTAKKTARRKVEPRAAH